jgi:L-iditol 2-dehydrogenase
MRVARLHGAGDVRLDDAPDPVPAPGEVLVSVTVVGICGSDLHWFEENAIGEAALSHPLVLGHEAAGVIAAGPGAGQRVAIDPSVACGACDTCRRGLPHLCPDVRFLGHSVTDGAMRERMSWPQDHLVALPDAIDDEGAAMLEPLGVALHALRLSGLRPGGSIGIFGAGPIGRLSIRLALAAGASVVVATDRLPHRVVMAREDGAIAELVDGGERERLLDALDGRLLDTAIEIAGDDDAIATAVTLVRPAARVVIAGIATGNTSTVPASIARRKGLDLRFSRRMNHVYPEAIALAASGRVLPGAVVTNSFGLSDVVRAFEFAAGRAGSKTVVRCDR